MLQTEPNQAAHAPRVRRAAVEDHLVVDLLVVGHPEPAPGGPKRVDDVLPPALRQWLHRTPPGSQVDAVQAEEADGARQEPRADKSD